MPGEVAMYAFTGPPQPVEVLHRGTWYRGELLGWRNDPGGRCVARVRCVVGKLTHSAWVALADLRLPDPDGVAEPNPPIDLGPAVRPRRRTATPVPPLPHSNAPKLPLVEGETRPHDLLPVRTPQQPPTPERSAAARRLGRPLPPPRAYQQHLYSRI